MVVGGRRRVLCGKDVFSTDWKENNSELVDAKRATKKRLGASMLRLTDFSTFCNSINDCEQQLSYFSSLVPSSW